MPVNSGHSKSGADEAILCIGNHLLDERYSLISEAMPALMVVPTLVISAFLPNDIPRATDPQSQLGSDARSVNPTASGAGNLRRHCHERANIPILALLGAGALSPLSEAFRRCIHHADGATKTQARLELGRHWPVNPNNDRLKQIGAGQNCRVGAIFRVTIRDSAPDR